MTNSNPNKTTQSSISRCNKRKASPSASRKGPDSKAKKGNNGERATSSPSSSNDGSGVARPVVIVESWTPMKSKNDSNEYKVIKLSNGLRACLISRKQPIAGSPRPFGGKGLRSTPPFLRDNLICKQYHDQFDFQSNFLSQSQIPSLIWNDDSPACDFFGGVGRPSFEDTSIAMTVNLGGLDDPKDAQGLAHFTEHVLHNGSEEFPSEDEASELVWNFGHGNAYTNRLTTTYYNSVSDLVIEKNLKVFADMLVKPSMKVDFIQREVHTIDDEFYLNLDETFRFHECLHAHVGYDSVHPLSRLWCGKLETLGNGTLKGSIHVQDKMKQSHRKNYVASAMTFAINSTKSIPELEELTLAHFSQLPQGKRQIRRDTNLKDWARHKLMLPRDGRHIIIQGISSKAELCLLWHLPSSIYLHGSNEKTIQVIKHLLSDSHSKGLIAHLKNEGLIWGAYLYHDCTPYAILLEMNFMLTEKGRSNPGPNLIQNATEDYIKFLQGVNEEVMSRYFDQMKISRQRRFEYGVPRSSLETTLDCAYNLQIWERPNEILYSESWLDAKFNYARIKETLKRMTGMPGVTVIETLPKQSSLEEKLAEVHAKRKPRIMEVPFSKARYFEIPRKFKSTRGDVFSTYDFPRVSTYLEHDLRLLRSEPSNLRGGADMPPQQPKSIFLPPENHGNILPQRLFYRSQMGHPSRIPKISGWHYGHVETSSDPYECVVDIFFITPSQRSPSPRATALSWLWGYCIWRSLATSATESILAGFERCLFPGSGRLAFQIRGFPTHIEDEATKIIGKVFDYPISDSTFNLAKEKLKQHQEIYLGEPTEEIITSVLFAQNDLITDILGIIEELTLNELRLYIQASRESTYAFVKLKGNVPISAFHTIAAALDKMDFGPFMNNPPDVLHYLIPRSNLYTPGETCVRLKNWANCTFTNSVTNLYILGRDFGSGCYESECYKVAKTFINVQAFSFLRTQKQLAYSVRAMSVRSKGLRDPIMMFKVRIVATAMKHTMCELDQKIDEFLSGYGDYLSNLSDDIYNKMDKLKGFTVTKKEVSAWFSSKFGPNFRHPNRHTKCLMKGIRKVSIQEIGCGNPMSETKKCECEVCEGIQEWVKGRNHRSHLEFAVGNKQYSDYFDMI